MSELRGETYKKTYTVALAMLRVLGQQEVKEISIVKRTNPRGTQ